MVCARFPEALCVCTKNGLRPRRAGSDPGLSLAERPQRQAHVLGPAIDGRVHVAIDQSRVTTLRIKEENLAYNRKDKVRKPAYHGNSGAISTMPREAVEHYNRGQRCSERGDNEGARSAWEAALSLSTDGAAATVLLTWASCTAGAAASSCASSTPAAPSPPTRTNRWPRL